MNTMRAAVCNGYGEPSVVVVREVPRPEPKRGEVQVRVVASAINAADWRMRKPQPQIVRLFFGLRTPKQPILGQTFSGVVSAVGAGVKTLRVGDNVFGSTGMNMAAHAEYLVVNASEVVTTKPRTVSHAVAACMPFGCSTAHFFVERARVKRGDDVLVYGASGAVGSAIVQLARIAGARVTTVTGADSQASMKRLGAVAALDYRSEAFTKHTKQYAVVFDAVGKLSYTRARSLVADGGTLVLVSGGPGHMVRGVLTNLRGKCRVVFGVAIETREQLLANAKLLASGKLRPLIDRSFSLDEIADAHAYAQSWKKKGNAPILIGRETRTKTRAPQKKRRAK